MSQCLIAVHAGQLITVGELIESLSVAKCRTCLFSKTSLNLFGIGRGGGGRGKLGAAGAGREEGRRGRRRGRRGRGRKPAGDSAAYQEEEKQKAGRRTGTSRMTRTHLEINYQHSLYLKTVSSNRSSLRPNGKCPP